MSQLCLTHSEMNTVYLPGRCAELQQHLLLILAETRKVRLEKHRKFKSDFFFLATHCWENLHCSIHTNIFTLVNYLSISCRTFTHLSDFGSSSCRTAAAVHLCRATANQFLEGTQRAEQRVRGAYSVSWLPKYQFYGTWWHFAKQTSRLNQQTSFQQSTFWDQTASHRPESLSVFFGGSFWSAVLLKPFTVCTEKDIFLIQSTV